MWRNVEGAWITGCWRFGALLELRDGEWVTKVWREGKAVGTMHHRQIHMTRTQVEAEEFFKATMRKELSEVLTRLS